METMQNCFLTERKFNGSVRLKASARHRFYAGSTILVIQVAINLRLVERDRFALQIAKFRIART